MNRWHARWFVVAAGAAAAACGLVIGLDDRPARPESADGGGDASVANDDGASRPPTFCDQQDGAVLFCEDFDTPDAGFSHWNGFPPALPYTHGGEAGAAIITTDAAPSQPNAILYDALVMKAGERSAAALVASLDAGGARALELSFQLVVDSMNDNRPEKPDAGPQPDGGNPDWTLTSELGVASGGVGALVQGEPAAALFLFTPDSMAIAVVRDQTTKLTLVPTDSNFGRIDKTSLRSFRGSAWARVTLLLGETATVTARATEIFKHAPDCPKTPAVAVAGSDVTFTNMKCLAVRDEFADVGSYPVIVTSGVSLQDLGDVRLRTDNFVLRRLP